MSGRPRDLSNVDLIVLVHDDSIDSLARSTASLSESMGAGWSGKLILVENDASPRTSSAARALLVDRFPTARRVLVRSRRNLGFGAGINLGMAHAQAAYFGVFGSDGAAERETVTVLAEALERHPEALSVAARTPSARDAAQDPEIGAVDWQPGAATLYRRTAFFELGGFDPLYFMYSEDSELSQRARQAGWKLLRARNAIFRHSHASWGWWRRFDRMRLFVMSSTTWSYATAPSRLALLRRLGRKRARWFASMARQRRFAQLLGAVAGTLWWPTRIPRIEHRRRHPWDQDAFEAWLLETLPRVEVSKF
jgi:GT2 family glycosyltransferase